MKKCLPIILATLLMAGALTGCAGRNSSPEQGNAPVPGSESGKFAIDKPSANVASGPAISPDASNAYKKLIAYRTGDYGQQSIADFNAALASTPDELTEFLAAVADVSGSISPDDENYDFFTTTISFSSRELYCDHMGEELFLPVSLSKQSRPCSYLDDKGETVYDFACFIDLNAAYSINNPRLVTVAERDQALLTYSEEMQNYLNGLSEAKIEGSDIKNMLIDKSAELAKNLSTENMKLSPCKIYMIDVHNAESES